MKIRFALALLLTSALACYAQEKPAPDLKPGSISGTVIKEPGSQPLKKAIVLLVSDQHAETHTYTITTDSDGRFSFDNVQPGRYHLLLEKTGYLAVNSRKHRLETQSLTLSPGQHLDGLRLTMLMTATISGRVVDEDGDPIADVQVNVFLKAYGKSEWERANSERTNDVGEYRISGLSRGRYYLSATPPLYYRSVRDSQSHDDLRPVTTYYPGTPDRNQANSLELHPGDELPVNLTMNLGRTFSIRGIVSPLPASKSATVLARAREAGLAFNASRVDKDGRFEIKDLSPGSYTIVAYGDDENAPFSSEIQRVEVGSHDLEGIKLVPASPGTLRGQVVVEPRSKLSQCYVFLQSVGEEEQAYDQAWTIGPSGRGAHVNVDGSFEINQVPRGTYTVELTSRSSELRGYFVQSVRLAGTNVDAGFPVSGNTGPLTILLGSNASQLSGATVDEHDKPVADAVVIAVPEERFRKLEDRYGKARTDQNGRFVMRDLAPGRYTVYAWEDLDNDAYLDADFLKTQQDHGVAIHAAPGPANPPLVLHAFPAPEDAN